MPPHLQALEQTLEPQPAYAAPTTPVALLDIAVAPADAPADADAPSGADAAGVDDADDDDDDGDGDGPSAGAIAAIVLATLLLFVTVLALCLCARLRKSREASGKGAVAEEPGAAGQPHPVAKAPPLYLPGAAPTLPWDKPRAVVRSLSHMPDSLCGCQRYCERPLASVRAPHGQPCRINSSRVSSQGLVPRGDFSCCIPTLVRQAWLRIC